MSKLLVELGASPDKGAFDRFASLQKLDSKRYKDPEAHPRIYPLYFANVIVADKEKRKIHPMRYRVRPKDSSEEVPNRYNLFNARLDSLETRKTWNPLFMRNHGILLARGFFEWVSVEGKKQVVCFQAPGQEFLPIPILYDQWTSVDGTESFESFALITREPTPEILAAGHDRCPITLDQESIDQWLHPKSSHRSAIKKLLENSPQATYTCSNAAP